MNPFIKGKFLKVVWLGFAIIALATTFISLQQYDDLRQQTIKHAFDDEELFNERLENQLKVSNAILVSAANVILTELYSRFDVYGLNQTSTQHIELFSFRSINSNAERHIALKRSGAYSQALETLRNSGYFDAVSLIAVVEDNGFQLVEAKSNNTPLTLLNWLNDLTDLTNKKPHVNNVLYSPPLLESGSLYNYVLVQLPVPNASPVFLAAQLNNSLFESDLDSTFIMWQTETNRVVAANMFIKGHDSDSHQNFLVTRYVPQEWHDDILLDPSVNRLTKVHRQMDTDWFINKSALSFAPFNILYFKEANIALAQIQRESLYEAFKLASISVLGFFVLLAFIYWLFVRPISNFLNFIEQQNSFYDLNQINAPNGWERWFDKIRLSFKENRNLYNALVQKNQLLDEKIARRTQELRRQTKSKDRNLALNRAIINSLPDMIYYKNIDGSFVGCNSAFEEFCGFTEQELVTQLAEDIFDQHTAQQLSQFDVHALQTNRLFSGKVWHEHSNNKMFINWLVAPIINSEGELLGTVGLGRDITQGELFLKEVESAKNSAEEANRIKSEFIANMSHEIRTPITAIIGMLDLLQSTSPSSVQKSYVDVATSSSQHLLQIINDILDFSKLNAGMMELTKETFDINEVFSVAFANSLPAAMKKELMLDIQLPPSCPTLFVGDKIKLTQVLTNLINNAVKFTESGQVSLSTELLKLKGDHARMSFSVTDTGSGIPEDKQHTIFKAFSQADNTITRKFGGTGLGLAIVFQIVELMGGQVKVQSDVGVGTTFTVTLPLKVAKPNGIQNELNDSREIEEDIQWVIVENDTSKITFLHNKLLRLNQQVVINQFDDNKSSNVVVICRPESVKSLPKTVKEKLLDNRWRLQPVVFDVMDLRNSNLAGFEYLPILVTPFSDASLLINTANSVSSQHDQEHLPNFTSDVSTNDISVGGLRGLHLLVVEDNEINQHVISLLLSSEGATCDLAGNGVEGLDLLSKKSYDAVILDIQMPIMDGLTMSSKVRANPVLKNMPLLAMTAHTGDDSKMRAMEAGIDVHLSKPIDKPALVASIQALVLDELLPLDGVLALNDILAQVGNSKQVLTKLIGIFYNTKRAELFKFLDDFENLHDEEIFDRLHNFEGMLGNLRATHCVERIKKLRDVYRTADPTGIEIALKDLGQEIDKLFQSLEEYLDNRG